MNVTTMGLDIAKNVFQAHGVDRNGKVVLRKKLTRAKVLEFFVNRSPCLIGLEACPGAHYWARGLIKFGHTVKLMPLAVTAQAEKFPIALQGIAQPTAYAYRCTSAPVPSM